MGEGGTARDYFSNKRKGDLWVRKILVVEDEPCIREILEEFVTLLGFEASLAANGAEGWAKFQEEGPFHLYLLDIKLPKIDGLELARRIRQEDPAHPIVFLTGLMENQIGCATSKIAHTFHLKKPITFADLKNIFKEAGLL